MRYFQDGPPEGVVRLKSGQRMERSYWRPVPISSDRLLQGISGFGGN